MSCERSLLENSDGARTEPVEKIRWSADFQSARSVGSTSFAGRDARAPAKKAISSIFSTGSTSSPHGLSARRILRAEMPALLLKKKHSLRMLQQAVGFALH
jgi:hypothetical protein